MPLADHRSCGSLSARPWTSTVDQVRELLPALPENWERCLAVAAHPDDIEYGTASAVARWTAQGKTVTYLLATRGEAGIDGMDPKRAAVVREEEERVGARE